MSGQDRGRPDVTRLVGARPTGDVRLVSLALFNFITGHVATPDPARGEVSGPTGILFAVSGGADSLAMVVAGADVAARAGIPFAVGIVDHQMRPGSDQEAQAVKARLETLGISGVQVLTPHHPQRDGGPEDFARDLRHGALEDLALRLAGERGLDSVTILYGHTLDDQAETVLMRLGRGASIRALAAMRAHSKTPRKDGSGVTLYRGRPLLQLRRENTEGFCAQLGLEWEEDPTNEQWGPWRTKGGAPLPRAALRHEVLPALGAALRQDPAPALARVAALAAEDEDALAGYATHAFEECVEVGEGREEVKVDVQALATHPKAVRSRVLGLAWTHLAGQDQSAATELSRSHVEALDALAIAPVTSGTHPVGKTLMLPGKSVARRGRGHLTMSAGGHS